ncbi:MAG TPA: copper resistance protein NlpE [Gammaproteobacteria bacterium]|nr:copper resistance protein NlpE [Gammaproteobacteria bacterium]
MNCGRGRLLLLPVSLFALAACSGTKPAPAYVAAPPHKTFTSTRYNFRLTYPAGLELHHSFHKSYLATDGWKTYLGPDGPPGRPLVALVMQDSNNITDGELRIGVSRDPAAIKTCMKLPGAARPDTQRSVTIDGVPFTTFKAADAAMSHYLIVQSFRGVHRRTCYAFDVLVFGTNPMVYSPPATPPFSKDAVFETLVPVVMHVEFIDAAVAIAPPVTYKGLLPCADCPGIEYRLNLLADHRYRLRLDYQDRDAMFGAGGRWELADNGSRLLLHEKNAIGSLRQWAILDGGRRLRLLDADGKPIRSGLNYDLVRQAQFEKPE